MGYAKKVAFQLDAASILETSPPNKWGAPPYQHDKSAVKPYARAHSVKRRRREAVEIDDGISGFRFEVH